MKNDLVVVGCCFLRLQVGRVNSLPAKLTGKNFPRI